MMPISVFSSLDINSVYLDEKVSPGDTMEIYVNIGSSSHNDDIYFDVSVLDLNIWQSDSMKYLSDTKTKRLIFYIPEDAKEGYYDLRVSLSSSDEKATVYRSIEII
jgi:hypothetical protein